MSIISWSSVWASQSARALGNLVRAVSHKKGKGTAPGVPIRRQTMTFVIELLLFVTGFLLGLWYTAMLVLPLFYGVPKSLFAWFRQELQFRAVLAYLVAPFFWIVFFTAILAGMRSFWRTGFYYLRESGGFNFGDALGSLTLIANALLSKKAKANMKIEFEEFVQPYRKHA